MSQTPLFPPAAAGTEGHSQISGSILFCLTQNLHSLSKNGEGYRIELDEPKTLDPQAQMISRVAERQCYFIDLMPKGDSMLITAYDEKMAKQVEFTDKLPTIQMLENRLQGITLKLGPVSQAQET
ncbi:MAG: hypothetical protein ACK5GN_10310 [Pseudomonadota bacterium]|jgi:hypothetical protein